MAIAFWTVNLFEKHQGLHLNGQWIPKEELLNLHQVDSDLPNLKEAKAFAAQMFNQDTQIEVQTSGSTGTPKKISFAKSAFLQSAMATNEFFGLTANTRTTLPLPMRYIAGKMMVVRAIVGKHHLTVTEPSGNPLTDLSQNDFIPVTPFQMSHILEEPVINQIGIFLIGGGAIGDSLKTEIISASVTAYSSFGMTETLSHFALAKIEGNGPLWYKPLNGVSIRTDKLNQLEINWPGITSGWLQTGDLVETKNSTFRWLGRSDYLINSGGINLIPEEIESELSAHIESEFFVYGVPHDTLGQEVVLFIEANSADLNLDKMDWKTPYHRPKSIQSIPAFSRTFSGKIKRNETVENWLKTKS